MRTGMLTMSARSGNRSCSATLSAMCAYGTACSNCACAWRLDEVEAHPVQREDALDHDRAAEQAAEAEGDDGHERDEGVAQRVPDHDAPLSEALPPRRA